MREISRARAAAGLLLLLPACGTVHRGEPAPFMLPTSGITAEAPDDGPSEAVGFRVSQAALDEARARLGVAGLDFGNAVLQACPDVVPARFDYDTEKMRSAQEASLQGLGRCSATGRLAESRLLLLVWDQAAGEALVTLLVQSGTAASRLLVESQTGGASAAPPQGAGEWARLPKVRVEVAR